VYVAVVIDLFSRRVVGWSIINTMTVQLVTDALMMRAAGRGECLFAQDRDPEGRANGVPRRVWCSRGSSRAALLLDDAAGRYIMLKRSRTRRHAVQPMPGAPTHASHSGIER
jgi:transposase InsO family protein